MEGLTLTVCVVMFLPSFSASSENVLECSEAERRSATSWISQENAYLSGHVMKLFSTSSGPLQCGHQCLKHSWCISVNFKLEDGQCELNNFGVSPGGVLADKLTRRTGFLFYQFATPVESCHDNPCKNGGTCVPMTSRSLFGPEVCEPTKPKCRCAYGFHGDVCQYKDECASNPCQNGATCVDGSGNYTCSCEAGFTGITCETDIDDCEVNPCQHGGTCTDGTNAFTCSCPTEYTGGRCESAVASVLSFPNKSLLNSVHYSGVLPNLTQFTLCVWMNISAPGLLGIFSYRPDVHSVNLKNSYLMMVVKDSGQLVLSAGGMEYQFNCNITRDGEWHPLCVVWTHSTGTVDLYYDGQMSGSITPGSPTGLPHIEGYGDFVLGQILLENGPGFNSSSSFVGDITKFNMWSYKRWNSDLEAIASTCGKPPIYFSEGDAISWSGLKNQTHNGDVVVGPRPCP